MLIQEDQTSIHQMFYFWIIQTFSPKIVPMILIRPIGERDPRTVPGGSVKPKLLGRKLESKGGFLLGVAMNRPVPVLVSSVLVGNVRRSLTVYFLFWDTWYVRTWILYFYLYGTQGPFESLITGLYCHIPKSVFAITSEFWHESKTKVKLLP